MDSTKQTSVNVLHNQQDRREKPVDPKHLLLIRRLPLLLTKYYNLIVLAGNMQSIF